MGAKFTMFKDQLLVCIDKLIDEDVKLIKELKMSFSNPTEVRNESGAFIEELEKLKWSTNAMHSVAFLNDFHGRDTEKATRLMVYVYILVGLSINAILSVVPSPPAQVYSPFKKDMSWTGLPEFADDTITDYSRPTPAIESNSYDLQNRNPCVTETRASSSTILSKPAINFVKSTDRPTETKTDKVETAKKLAVKYDELYRKTSKSANVRGNQRN
nr:hypothetical protein [Tanacetum cinerariifolium]